MLIDVIFYDKERVEKLKYKEIKLELRLSS